MIMGAKAKIFYSKKVSLTNLERFKFIQGCPWLKDLKSLRTMQRNIQWKLFFDIRKSSLNRPIFAHQFLLNWMIVCVRGSSILTVLENVYELFENKTGKVSCFSLWKTSFKLIVFEKPHFKNFSTKLNRRKRKWILNISVHIEILKQCLEKNS